MGFFKFSLALVLVFFITFSSNISSSFAQNSPQDFLAAHNAARSQVNVSPMSWDANLAAYAQSYANGVQNVNKCDKLGHSGDPHGDQNQAAGFPDLTAQEAVNLWVTEKSDYDHQSNTCADGKVCGHYTQVVWRNSVRLGCARVHCDNGWSYVTCSYDPRGNIIGQRPY